MMLLFGLFLAFRISFASAANLSSYTAGIWIQESGNGDNVTIVSPSDCASNDVETLAMWCENEQEHIRSIIFAKGGLLLRGWNISHVSEAEQLIFEKIGLSTMELWPQTFVDFNLRAQRLSVAPGGLTQTKLSRNAPPAEMGTIQCPHVEFGLGPHRPRIVSFFVETPPAVGGATARVFFPDAVKRLSPYLYKLLKENGWWVNLAGTVQPSLLVHPETGHEALQLYAYSTKLAPLAHKAYTQVRESERPDLPEALSIPYNGDLHFGLELVRPNGTHFELTEELQLEYFRAIFSTIRLQYWEKGDVMLFDNVLYGHFRMPGKKPRKLHAMFAEQVDTRKFLHPDAPECVKKGAMSFAKGAVQVMLDQLGPGGNMYVLWLMMQLPDTLFKWAGFLFWADGGGYATVNADVKGL